ncbi:MAG: hypothetical protein HY910_07785 [Desulfarculus sp.]|nr:hypothetical protein [Desulfarculus sp.]
MKRVAALAVWCLLMLCAVAAGAGQYSLDQNQAVYLPGTTLPAYLTDGQVTYVGTGAQLQALGQQAASSNALAASTYWWHFSTSGHYDFWLPGTADGAYTSFYNAAVAINPYLGNAYDSASAVLGKGNDGYGNIDIWLTYEPGSPANGYYIAGQGANNIYLNMAQPGSGALFGGVAAHETTHLILDHAANLYNRDPLGSNWYTEALAYYVGNSVYAHGDQNGYAYNSAWLKQYSQNGAWRSSWYDSGARYIQGGASSLDYAQLNTIGYFLANSNLGWSAIQGTVNNLVTGRSLESSLQAAYGLASGMYSTSSGSGVNTLYSYYINYYLGHY